MWNSFTSRLEYELLIFLPLINAAIAIWWKIFRWSVCGEYVVLCRLHSQHSLKKIEENQLFFYSFLCIFKNATLREENWTITFQDFTGGVFYRRFDFFFSSPYRFLLCFDEYHILECSSLTNKTTVLQNNCTITEWYK